jgi:phenylacetate-CoA ligase
VEVRLLGRQLRYTKASLVRGSGTGAKVRTFYDASTLIPFKPRRVRISSAQPLPDLVAEINEVRPEIMRGNGSVLELLFRHLAATGTRMQLPQVLVYGSDTMTTEGRELIEREFGLPVLSHYNATECFQIAHFCEERRDFHLQADLCHAMVLGPDGGKAAPGEVGELVLTNLVNRGSVFLNYRIGDTAALPAGLCSCGRTSPLLSQLGGRVEDIVRLEDGTLVHPRFVWDVVKQHPAVTRYQLVQHASHRFEIRLVTARPEQFEPIAEAVVHELSRLYGGAQVDATHHEDLEPGPGGKFRSVVALKR